jgi:hypothetical protein
MIIRQWMQPDVVQPKFLRIETSAPQEQWDRFRGNQAPRCNPKMVLKDTGVERITGRTVKVGKVSPAIRF